MHEKSPSVLSLPRSTPYWQYSVTSVHASIYMVYYGVHVNPSPGDEDRATGMNPTKTMQGHGTKY